MNALPPLRIKSAPETPDAGYQPQDDLRHRAAPGGKMRDSLFWEMIMPDEKVGFQAYLYLTGVGKVGFNVAIWGPDPSEQVLDLGQCGGPDDMDFKEFRFGGLALTQPDLPRTATLCYQSPKVRFEFD